MRLRHEGPAPEPGQAGRPANQTKIAMFCRQTMIGLRAEFQTVML
jgi:hypothetical protein